MQLEVIKVIKPFFGIFEVFWCMTCSQHDGHHVGFTFQGFANCGKLGGTWEHNLVGIWLWCEGCHSLFTIVFWSTRPCCQWIYYNKNWCYRIRRTIRSWRKYSCCGGFNWKIFLNTNHWTIVLRGFLSFICMCQSINLVVNPWKLVFKCDFLCKTNSWNLMFTNKNWKNV